MISLVGTVILSLFFGLMSFAFYSDRRVTLGITFAALVAVSVVAGAVSYPLIEAWQQSKKTESDVAYNKAMIQVFGNADTYIRYLEATHK